MTQWKNKTKKYLLSLLIISLFMITSVPTNVITSLAPLEFSQDNSNGISNMKGSRIFYMVPRLTNESITAIYERRDPNSANSSSASQSNNKKLPNFSIGTQEGQGGGNVAIQDSFNLTSIELLNTTNEIGSDKLPTTRNDSISILTPSNFACNDLQFNLSSIEAQPDWRLREDYMDLRTPWNSYLSDYKSVAMAFTVEEDYANLSRVRINLGVEGSPSGLIYIVNSTSNQPDNSKKLSNTQSILDRSSWREYSFTVTSPLKKGITYFMVMNSTSDGEFDYWEWRKNNNFDYGVDAGAVYAVIAPEYSTWYSQGPVDLPLQIQVQPVEKQGLSWVVNTYSSPDEVKIWYNTTLGERLLTRFDWFDANNTEIHNFESNISLTFNLDFHANYTYSGNPISGKTSYKAENDSIVNWNITFSISKINTPYLVTNRTVSMSGIQKDWNGTQIYWNNSSTPEYPDLANDPRVTWDGDPTHEYTHGNTTMVVNVNSSTIAANITWYIWAEAPNYLLAFNLSMGGVNLPFPYEANVTDIIDLDFEVPEIGGNISYWIEYYGSDIQRNLNFDSSNLLITDSWNINDSVSQTTNVNGTYNLQGIWENSNTTKVGTFIRNIDVFINTSLTVHPEVETEVIIGEILKVRVNFTSIHNDSLIRNAKIWCNSSWDSAPNKTLVQFINNTYGASLATTGMIAGETGKVIITTQLPWFVNWTSIIDVYFVENSSLIVNVTSLSLEWRANETLCVEYNVTGGSGIPGATITVDGDSQNTISISDVYYYRLNSTKYGGIGSFPSLLIKANKSGYLTREWYFDLTITLGHTNITGSFDGKPLYNDTTVATQPFASSSADIVTVNLQYYHNLTGNNLETSPSTIISPIPIYSTIKDESDLSWNITFNPNKTGVFVIYITFHLNNYKNSTFFFHLTVVKAGTAIEYKPLVDIPVYYTECYDFFLTYNNTDYNENIVGLIKDSGFTINNSKVVDVNQTDEGYWFCFNPSPSILPLGSHAITITFSHALFDTSSIEATFLIVDMPTKPLNVTNIRYNQSILVEDVLHISGSGYQTIRGQNISDLDTVVLRMNDTKVMESLYNYQVSQNRFAINFTTMTFHYGNYSLTMEIGRYGYQNQTISFNITLCGRMTTLEVSLPGKTFEQGDPIEITAILTYVQGIAGGLGAGLSLTLLEAVNISFYIELQYEDQTIHVLEAISQTNDQGLTSYIIDGEHTLGAVGFSNITVWSSAAVSGLPSRYSMSTEELAEYQIIKIIDPLEIIIPVIITGAILLLFIGAVVSSGIFLNRKRKQRSELIQRKRRKIEQSFEDIKSIRLLIARHESGLQFYSEKTIAELHTDTDALSGMSAALSSFMEEVSEGMRSRTDEQKEKEKIEVMSREGLHMLIWHGKFSSFIIISEVRLPDYFNDRLAKLGREVENKYSDNLQDFYSADQIPNSQIKKMVRKHIPLHYFSAFILNEGVLTLENIKLSGKEKKMLKVIKEILFQKEGIQFFFSEQIISHLSKHYNRSEAIKFLDRAIDINLLIEASQEDIISIGK